MIKRLLVALVVMAFLPGLVHGVVPDALVYRWDLHGFRWYLTCLVVCLIVEGVIRLLWTAAREGVTYRASGGARRDRAARRGVRRTNGPIPREAPHVDPQVRSRRF